MIMVSVSLFGKVRFKTVYLIQYFRTDQLSAGCHSLLQFTRHQQNS